MGLFVGRATKSFLRIIEVLISVTLVLIIALSIVYSFLFIHKDLAKIDAEVIEVVNISESSDEFGPYLYNVKYVLNDDSIYRNISEEPIENKKIAKVGETINISVNTHNGEIVPDLLYVITACGFVVWALLFLERVIKQLKVFINLLMCEGAKQIGFGVKRLVFQILGSAVLYFAIAMVFMAIYSGPKYFTDGYIKVNSEVLKVSQYTDSDYKLVTEVFVKYEYKGIVFKPDEKFASVNDNIKVGDNYELTIDSLTGEPAIANNIVGFLIGYLGGILVLVTWGIFFKFIAERRVSKDIENESDLEYTDDIIECNINHENKQKILDMKRNNDTFEI